MAELRGNPYHNGYEYLSEYLLFSHSLPTHPLPSCITSDLKLYD